MKKLKIFYYKPVETPISTREKLSKNDGKEKFDKTICRSLVGSLIYLTNTKLDIVYAINIRFIDNPSKDHFAVIKRILRYIKGIKSFDILYNKEGDNNLKGYIDSD